MKYTDLEYIIDKYKDSKNYKKHQVFIILDLLFNIVLLMFFHIYMNAITSENIFSYVYFVLFIGFSLIIYTKLKDISYHGMHIVLFLSISTIIGILYLSIGFKNTNIINILRIINLEGILFCVILLIMIFSLKIDSHRYKNIIHFIINGVFLFILFYLYLIITININKELLQLSIYDFIKIFIFELTTSTYLLIIYERIIKFRVDIINLLKILNDTEIILYIFGQVIFIISLIGSANLINNIFIGQNAAVSDVNMYKIFITLLSGLSTMATAIYKTGGALKSIGTLSSAIRTEIEKIITSYPKHIVIVGLETSITAIEIASEIIERDPNESEDQISSIPFTYRNQGKLELLPVRNDILIISPKVKSPLFEYKTSNCQYGILQIIIRFGRIFIIPYIICNDYDSCAKQILNQLNLLGDKDTVYIVFPKTENDLINILTDYYEEHQLKNG